MNYSIGASDHSNTRIALCAHSIYLAFYFETRLARRVRRLRFALVLQTVLHVSPSHESFPRHSVWCTRTVKVPQNPGGPLFWHPVEGALDNGNSLAHEVKFFPVEKFRTMSPACDHRRLGRWSGWWVGRMREGVGRCKGGGKTYGMHDDFTQEQI